ncbi:MAG: metallophosphoesterase [Daejeonella sp.]
MRKRNYLPLLILASISLLLDWYVYKGVIILSQISEYKNIVAWIYWLISIFVLSGFIFLLSKVIASRKFTAVFNITFNSYLTLFVSKLVFAMVLFAQDIYRFFAGLVHFFYFNAFITPDRIVWVNYLALFMALIPFFSFLFGVTLGKYNYKIRRTILHFKDLPDEFDRFTLVQISDVHSGSFDKPEEVKKGVKLINSLKPDIFVFTGDLVNNTADEIVPYIQIFNKIKSSQGNFSILGNHDYGDYIGWKSPAEKIKNLENLKKYHADLGFRLLLDENVRIKKGDQSITLLGVENWGKGFGERGDLKKALNNLTTSDFKILLSHDPSHWDEQVKNNHSKIHLTLSGHTHGMQFGIEIGSFKWSPVKYRYKNWAGLAEENGRFLYVNRGFGFLGFAGRIGIWPEITHITFRKK